MINALTSLNCAGTLLDLSQPRVMGILNLTPDSFYDGGFYASEPAVLQHCERLLAEGATIIDIGGASSRPGAPSIEPEVELARNLPAIRSIRRAFPQALLSVDTYWGSVARAVVGEGVQLINDISAGQMDPQLWPTLAELKVPYILMHMQGRPRDMQSAPQYESVTVEVLDFLIEKVGQLREMGLYDIVIDPGFGFGKTIAHNYQMLAEFSAFRILGLPVLAGLSRKSMIYKTLDVSAAEALNGTTALHMVALQGGASILRVHDVAEARQTIRLWEQLERAKPALHQTAAPHAPDGR